MCIPILYIYVYLCVCIYTYTYTYTYTYIYARTHTLTCTSIAKYMLWQRGDLLFFLVDDVVLFFNFLSYAIEFLLILHLVLPHFQTFLLKVTLLFDSPVHLCLRLFQVT